MSNIEDVRTVHISSSGNPLPTSTDSIKHFNVSLIVYISYRILLLYFNLNSIYRSNLLPCCTWGNTKLTWQSILLFTRIKFLVLIQVICWCSISNFLWFWFRSRKDMDCGTMYFAVWWIQDIHEPHAMSLNGSHSNIILVICQSWWCFLWIAEAADCHVLLTINLSILQEMRFCVPK